MLELYFHHTPNPMKVAVLLEELGQPYKIVPVDSFRGEQHSPAFRALNPNAKLPVIDDDGTIVFDSSAILLYLAEKAGRLLGNADERGSLLSWLMFVATGLGPYSGQAAHFLRVHTDSAYASNRYRREAGRHLRVLDERLSTREYIATRDYSIVDISAWAWIDRMPFIFGADDVLDATPSLKRWFTAIDSRPAVVRTREIAAGIDFKAEFDEETLRSLFPQNFTPAE